MGFGKQWNGGLLRVKWGDSDHGSSNFLQRHSCLTRNTVRKWIHEPRLKTICGPGMKFGQIALTLKPKDDKAN